jgi:hypothetical protein
MLSLYGSLKVPGVNSVTIYRDDEDPHLFYMMSERPTIARDEAGEPLFTFVLYARDVDRLGAEDREVERGYLSLSTRVAVPAADEEKIRQHLRGLLNGELSGGRRFLLHPILRAEPKLSYPPVFTDGKVEFVTFGDDMVRFSAGSKQSSLVGENIASFAQSLSQDGAEFFRQSVEKGIVPSLILYELNFLARIPAVTIRIHGDRKQFYEELKQHTIVTEIHRRNGRVVSKKTWPEIGSLREFQSKFHSLTVDIDSGDFREEPPGQDTTQKLEELAFRILETNILPSFFEQGFSPATEEQSKNKWLKDIEKDLEGTIDVTIRKRDVIKKAVNPNAQLGLILNPEEIKSHTTYLDLGQTVFQELDLKINANVNFQADPVFALKVFVDYNQKDEIRNVTVARSKEFLFKTGNEVHRFRQILAKAADGAPKDAYKFHSELVYKDTGESIRIPAQGDFESRERELIVSYRRLGFVKVTVALGSMPDNVKSAQVTFRYPASNLATASQTFELTKDKPSAVFFTHTGSAAEPQPYRYQVTFQLIDGQRMDMPEVSETAETLTISNPFEQALTTRFLAQADFDVVQKIIIDARYQDQRNDFQSDTHAELSQNGETAAWTLSLRDPNLRQFEYDETIVFRNGSRETKTGKVGRLGTTIPAGMGAVDALEITVDVGLLDWQKFARALVFLEYKDPTNNVAEHTEFRFDATGDQVRTWKVLLRDKTKRTYQYRIRLIGKSQSDDQDGVPTPETDPFLIVR